MGNMTIQSSFITENCSFSTGVVSSSNFATANEEEEKKENLMMMLQVGPGDDYMLTLGGFNNNVSTLGDSMFWNNRTKFSTK